MGYGDACSQCGRKECSWVCGPFCEGNTPRPPEGHRIRFGHYDFGIPGFFFYVEKYRKGWFWGRWEEVEGCRRDTPIAALNALKDQLACYYRESR
jgi:hypothetical protein